MSFGSGSSVSPPAAAGVAARLLVLLVDAYRMVLSPLFFGSCRFEPSCSAYAREALVRHGALRGLALTLRRLSRCRPLGPHGYDPVP